DGVSISNGAGNNTIGGAVAAARNIISGNTVRGLRITGAGTSQNVVAGNYVGTNLSGTAAVANSFIGVLIDSGATNNSIDTNSVSGNLATGIVISAANNNPVTGNWVGLNAAGTAAIANYAGIGMESGAQNNTIGGTTVAARNVVSGNQLAGTYFQGIGTSNN